MGRVCRIAQTCALDYGAATSGLFDKIVSEENVLRVLITGGAGFIGSNIARALAQSGHAVIISDWLGEDAKWKNLIDVDVYDIVRPEALSTWLANDANAIDAIVHMGAISATTERDVDKIVENNIRLTFDLWAYASAAQVPFIFASSAATYGDGAQGFADDESAGALSMLRPLNPYGWSKLAIDRRVLSDVRSNRPRPPQWAGLRFFNVYGPGEDHKGDMRSVINKIHPGVAAGGKVSLFKSYRPDYEDGEQLRDFVYVKDCVAVVRWLLTNPAVSGLFNVGAGEARSFKDLATAVFDAAGREPRIEFIDMPESLRPAYQYYTVADLKKLRDAGFSHAMTTLEDGVKDYVVEHLAKSR